MKALSTSARAYLGIRSAFRFGFMFLILSFLTNHFCNAQVGIGIVKPQARLHVYDGSILGTTVRQDPAINPFYDKDAPDSVDFKLKWFHNLSAFRSIGYRVSQDYLSNIGLFSLASGFEVSATGSGATALGVNSVADGDGSIAGGISNFALGYASVALGFNSFASGDYSVALGTYANTNQKVGAFVLTDNSGAIVQSSANNQMKMRFAGGYNLYTNSNATIGVSLAPGGNSWTTISDVNKKENFQAVNGEEFLEKIKQFKLSSWNYKGQDPRYFRHYGPMAQDFFGAFGHDGVGVAGSDTTINQADFDGVNLVAIQALIRRTEDLQRANDQLLLEIASIKQQMAASENAGLKRKRRILLSKR